MPWCVPSLAYIHLWVKINIWRNAKLFIFSNIDKNDSCDIETPYQKIFSHIMQGRNVSKFFILSDCSLGSYIYPISDIYKVKLSDNKYHFSDKNKTGEWPTHIIQGIIDNADLEICSYMPVTAVNNICCLWHYKDFTKRFALELSIQHIYAPLPIFSP